MKKLKKITGVLPVTQAGNIYINPNYIGEDDLEIVRKKKSMTKKPNFIAISSGRDDVGKNLLQRIGDMDAAERWFFLLVEKRMDRDTNTAIIRSSSLTQSDKNKKTIGFKALNKKNLIKKVKREHYMINPNIIMPLYKDENGADIYLILKEKWANLP